jgi:hypothetical protein
LGESLIEQHGQETALFRPAWPFFQQKSREHALFPLFPYEEDDYEEISPCSEEDLPEGFQPGPDQKQTCWRLRLIRQLEAWKPHNSFRSVLDHLSLIIKAHAIGRSFIHQDMGRSNGEERQSFIEAGDLSSFPSPSRTSRTRRMLTEDHEDSTWTLVVLGAGLYKSWNLG